VSYSIDIDPAAQATISALPPAALLPLAEALAMLELTSVERPIGQPRT
jgi:hypothetical protein